RLVLTLSLFAAVARAGGPPPPPPRPLTGGDAQEGARPSQAASPAPAKGGVEQVIKQVEAIAPGRGKAQGEGHREAAHARAEVGRWRRLLRVPEARRKDVVEALRQMRQATGLKNQKKSAAAEKTAREALRLARQAAGEDHPLTGMATSTLANVLAGAGKYA